jgi:hypothetical protein
MLQVVDGLPYGEAEAAAARLRVSRALRRLGPRDSGNMKAF